jgi:hypothetical protein
MILVINNRGCIFVAGAPFFVGPGSEFFKGDPKNAYED